MVLGALATVVALVFVATASAGQVTKIMYAQENSDVYTYTNSGNTPGTLSVSIGWIDSTTGQPTTYPVGEVDGDIFSGPAGDPYSDLRLTVPTVQTLNAGTNPETGSYSLPANQTAYIAVLPYAGDNTYTLDVKFSSTRSQGTRSARRPTARTARYTCPQTATGSAAPSTGRVAAQAPCTPRGPTRSTSASPRVVRSTHCPRSSPPGSSRRRLHSARPSAAPGNPQSSEWYGVVPQIWPAAKVPNTPLVNGMPQPGTISATTAPLWYTYSFPDASVTGNPVAYFLTNLTNATQASAT